MTNVMAMSVFIFRTVDSGVLTAISRRGLALAGSHFGGGITNVNFFRLASSLGQQTMCCTLGLGVIKASLLKTLYGPGTQHMA